MKYRFEYRLKFILKHIEIIMTLLKDNNTLLAILDNLKNTYNLYNDSDISNTSKPNSKIVIKILRKLEILKNLIQFNNLIWITNNQMSQIQSQTQEQQSQTQEQQSQLQPNININNNEIMENGNMGMNIGIDDNTEIVSSIRINISYDLAIYELNYLCYNKKLYSKIDRVNNLLGFIINTIMVNDNYDLIIQNVSTMGINDLSCESVLIDCETIYDTLISIIGNKKYISNLISVYKIFEPINKNEDSNMFGIKIKDIHSSTSYNELDNNDNDYDKDKIINKIINVLKGNTFSNTNFTKKEQYHSEYNMNIINGQFPGKKKDTNRIIKKILSGNKLETGQSNVNNVNSVNSLLDINIVDKQNTNKIIEKLFPYLENVIEESKRYLDANSIAKHNKNIKSDIENNSGNFASDLLNDYNDNDNNINIEDDKKNKISTIINRIMNYIPIPECLTNKIQTLILLFMNNK